MKKPNLPVGLGGERKTEPTVLDRQRRHRPGRRFGGYTLIELIGALLISAGLVAVIAPRLFESISDSKVDQAARTIKALQFAVNRYHTDLGTFFPLNEVGIATPSSNGLCVPGSYQATLPATLSLSKTALPARTESGLWRKFQGPYTTTFPANPPLGKSPMMISAISTPPGMATGSNSTFSLGGNPEAGLPVGSQLVYVTFVGVEEREFEKLDSILDHGIGDNPASKEAMGKVKWDPNSGTLLVYIAHR